MYKLTLTALMLFLGQLSFAQELLQKHLYKTLKVKQITEKSFKWFYPEKGKSSIVKDTECIAFDIKGRLVLYKKNTPKGEIRSEVLKFDSLDNVLIKKQTVTSDNVYAPNCSNCTMIFTYTYQDSLPKEINEYHILDSIPFQIKYAYTRVFEYKKKKAVKALGFNNHKNVRTTAFEYDSLDNMVFEKSNFYDTEYIFDKDKSLIYKIKGENDIVRAYDVLEHDLKSRLVKKTHFNEFAELKEIETYKYYKNGLIKSILCKRIGNYEEKKDKRIFTYTFY
jgi:hypothetical protein